LRCCPRPRFKVTICDLKAAHSAAVRLVGQPIDRGDLEIAGIDGEAQRGLEDRQGTVRRDRPTLLGVAAQRVPHLDTLQVTQLCDFKRRIEPLDVAPHLARSPVGLAHDVRVPGVEERAQRERGDILAGKSAGLEARLGEAERGPRAHGDHFDVTAALAAQYPGAPAGGADAQVQSVAVAVPLVAGCRLECAYSPIRQHLPLRECIRDTP